MKCNEDGICVIAEAVSGSKETIKQGEIIGEFRYPRFARKAEFRMKDEAAAKGIRIIGIFQKRKFIEFL